MREEVAAPLQPASLLLPPAHAWLPLLCCFCRAASEGSLEEGCGSQACWLHLASYQPVSPSWLAGWLAAALPWRDGGRRREKSLNGMNAVARREGMLEWRMCAA